MSSNLTIRKMRESDLDPLYGLLSDQQVMKYIEPPYTKEKTEAFLRVAGLSDQPLIYAVELDGNFVGYVIYHDYDKESMEIGWVLYPRYWGMDFASMLTEQLIEKANASGKGVVIECDPEQGVSKRIARKFGFGYEGRVNGLEVFRREADPKPPEEKEAEGSEEREDTGRSFRVISNQVRFGCGYRTVDGRRQYFAWHGYPNRNDDYFTTAEISVGEYYEIAREYPREIDADRATAEKFRNKYVDGHPVLLEGWNKLL